MSLFHSLETQRSSLILPKEVYDGLPLPPELWDQVKSYFNQEEVTKTNCKMACMNTMTYSQCSREWHSIVINQDNIEGVMKVLCMLTVCPICNGSAYHKDVEFPWSTHLNEAIQGSP